MVSDYDWLTNFKLGVIVAAWNILVLISLMHFSEVVGMVFPQFVQFFQNYFAFVCVIIPVTIVKVRQMSFCWMSSKHKEIWGFSAIATWKYIITIISEWKKFIPLKIPVVIRTNLDVDSIPHYELSRDGQLYQS